MLNVALSLCVPVLTSSVLATVPGSARRLDCASEIVSASLSSPNPDIHHFENAALSADGRYVAFHSVNGTLVPGDTNNHCDVFVTDRVTGAIERVSVASDGTQIPGGSFDAFAMYPAISADGRYVAFESTAPNLVANDRNGAADVFVHDRSTGITTRVSVDSSGNEHTGDSGLEGNIIFPDPLITWFTQGLSISADGRYVAFSSWANLDATDVQNKDTFVHDRLTGTTVRASIGLGGSQAMGAGAALSADGRFVAFSSNSPALVTGVSGTNFQIYVRDLVAGTTTCESRSSSGIVANKSCYAPAALSSDGRYLAFRSGGTNLVSGDTNNREDIFVRDRVTGITVRASVTWEGSQANDASVGPQITADGQSVCFMGFASNMVPGGSPSSQPYVFDIATGRTRAIVASTSCQAPDGSSWYPALSADGSAVAFESLASNIAAGDSDGTFTLFAKPLMQTIAATPH